jgi:hypothetical protein
MANALYTITRDITYGFRDGGTQDGTPNYSGTPTDFTAKIKSHNYDGTSKTVSQAGITATDDAILVTRTNATETFECFYAKTAGPTFKSLIGHYIEITETIGALTATTRSGVVTAWREAGSDDGSVMETVTISYGAVGV